MALKLEPSSQDLDRVLDKKPYTREELVAKLDQILLRAGAGEALDEEELAVTHTVFNMFLILWDDLSDAGKMGVIEEWARRLAACLPES